VGRQRGGTNGGDKGRKGKSKEAQRGLEERPGIARKDRRDNLDEKTCEGTFRKAASHSLTQIKRSLNKAIVGGGKKKTEKFFRNEARDGIHKVGRVANSSEEKLTLRVPSSF